MFRQFNLRLRHTLPVYVTMAVMLFYGYYQAWSQ